jgi:hypothetical protein
MRPLIDKIPDDIVNGFLEFNKFVDNNTVEKKANVWVENVKENVKLIDFKECDGHKLKEMDFDKSTAYLIGAAPSLKKDLDELKKKKGTIISSAHAYKTLLEAGIEPHIVVAVDNRHETINYLDVGDKCKDTILFCDICIHPDVLRNWQGEVALFYGRKGEETDKLIQEVTDFKNYMSTGGSVLPTSVILAWSLGFKRIVFLGADFSYNGDRKTYWIDKEAPDYMFKEQGKAPMLDIHGNIVYGIYNLILAKFYIDLWSYQNHGIEFINSTCSGILGAYDEGNLKSIKQIPLTEVN